MMLNGDLKMDKDTLMYVELGIRGVVKEYSFDVEQRLVDALSLFLGDEPNGHEVYITLTTKMTDPIRTKDSFRKWMGAMRYSFDCCGIYVLEFGERGLVHYHVVLRFNGLQGASTEKLGNECFSRWRRYGVRAEDAFKIKPVWNRRGLVRYMAKLPDDEGNPHPERWQKCLPPALQGRGLGANWWGYVNRKAVKKAGGTL